MKTTLGFGFLIVGAIVGMAITLITGHAMFGLPVGFLIMSPAIFLLKDFREARKAKRNKG